MRVRKEINTPVIVEAITVVHLDVCCTSTLLLTNRVYNYIRIFQIASVVDK